MGLSRAAKVGPVALAGFGLLLGLTQAPGQADDQPIEDGDAVEQLLREQAVRDEALADDAAPDAVLTPQGKAKRDKKGNVIQEVNPQLDLNVHRKFGVAQTVTIRFPVPVKRRGAVERKIVVKTKSKSKSKLKSKSKSKLKLPPGRWGWIDAQTAVYRTKRFWPGNAKIQFKLKLAGATLGIDDGVRYVGSKQATRVRTLQTGRRFVMKIRNRTHTMYVRKNRKLVKKFGVSLGKAGYQTRSGVKVMLDTKYRRLRMRGTDRFTGEKWDVISPYSMPLTTNGEFVHGAPWARYRIGYRNGSHGCTNMNPEDARWVFQRVRQGDPLVTKGTVRHMYDYLAFGQGRYWALSWEQWKAKSAK